MTTEQRTAIFRWLLGGGTIVAAVLLWPQLGELSLRDSIVLASLIVLVALIENLGIRVSYGTVTLMPAAAMMAYFAMGLNSSLAAIVAGLILGGIFQLIMAWRRGADRAVPWWRRIGRQLFPIARNGLALIAADWAF